MAPSHEDSASSGEDDVPESISLTQSRRNMKKSEAALQQAHVAEKMRKKLRNKERDRRLKEQAENSKRKRKDIHNDGDTNIEAQMKRAKQGAAEEMNENNDSGESGSSGDSDEEEFQGIDGDSDEDLGKVSDDIDPYSEEDDEETDSGDRRTTQTNPDHLPDHLFASAFAPTNTKAASKHKVKQDSSAPSKPRKRIRSNAAPKDIIVGSRTLRRTLPLGPVVGASTLPSAKVRKFLGLSLGLHGNGSKKRGWERRPVNLGVMKRDGPAASFVRSR